MRRIKKQSSTAANCRAERAGLRVLAEAGDSIRTVMDRQVPSPTEKLTLYPQPGAPQPAFETTLGLFL
jgi:hypothetical protein